MKLFKYSLLASIFMSVTCVSAFAQAPIGAECLGTQTQINFGNGIDTTLLDAQNARAEIQRLVESELSNRNIELDVGFINQSIPDSQCKSLSFGVQYNPTEGPLNDLFEALIQDVVTDASQFWRTLFGLTIMSDAFREKFQEIAAKIDESALTSNPAVSSLVAAYNNGLVNADIKFIQVSHSQGNLFSNAIHANLNDATNFKIVSVANPDSFVAGDGPHTTLTLDLVILAVRQFKAFLNLPEPLPANTTNVSIGDLSGHKFLESYMDANSTSQEKILDDTLDFINVIPIVAEVCIGDAFFNFETLNCQCNDPNLFYFAGFGCEFD